MQLSPPQKRAVERQGQDVCVIAGPGSGKTRVLTERFAYLVEQRGMDAGRILAITFTEKAATEIKARLVKRFAHDPAQRASIERAWVATIDGFCTRLLREHALAAGLSPDFGILEQGTADRMLRGAAEAALDELFAERPDAVRELLEALDLSTMDDGPQPDLAASLIEVYQAMRVAGVDEIPAPSPALDLTAQVRDAMQQVLRDPTPGNTDNQRVTIPRAREWARRFLELSANSVTEDHFQLLGDFNFNLTYLVRKSPAHAAIKLMKEELLEPYQAACLTQWYTRLHELLRHAVDRIDAHYRARKRDENGVDFGDLVAFAVQLLERDPELRIHTSERFDQILMDELQDTNPLQWRLAQLILEGMRGRTRGAFFGVGDINQSIYGFRHADPALFRTYRDQLLATGATVDELEENYRSRAEILEHVDRVLAGAPGIEPHQFVAKGEFEPSAGPAVEYWDAAPPDEQAQPEKIEAAFVARRIQELVEAGRSYGQIAILVRSLPAAQAFEQALDAAGIPFLVSGGRTFFDARETRDLVNLMAALVNPLDEAALYGVLRGPLFGWGDAELHTMGREAWRERFLERFGAVRQLIGYVPPDALLAQALDQAGFLLRMPPRARANVEKFLSRLRREYRNQPRPWAELLDDFESLRQTQSEAQAPPAGSADAVRLMTMHAAKGLEFPVVFVSALHSTPRNDSPVIAFSAAHGLGAKWRNPLTGKGHSDSAHMQLKAERKAAEQAEEHRLLFVAMTRAEHHLILTGARRNHRSPWQKRMDAVEAPQPIVAGGLALVRAARSGSSGVTLLETPVDTGQVNTGQYDAVVSATAVAEFAQCPRKYMLGRALGFDAESTGPGTGAIETGLLVHRILAGDRKGATEEALELAERFERSAWGQRARRADRVEREFDFLLPIGDVLLSGQIDLWFEEAGELILVDYKTDRTRDGAAAYALQLQLYALAVERYAGRVADRAVLFYLRSEEVVEVPLTPEALEQARSSLRSLQGAQETLLFPLNQGTPCARCRYYRGLCPSTWASE